MHKIKMIVLDIDGTIMTGQYTISQRVKESIHKAVDKGIKVVLATGRMYNSAVPVAKELCLTTPLITYQGSLIKEFYSSQKILLHHQLDNTVAMNVIEELRKFNVQINAFDLEDLYVEKETQALKEYSNKRFIKYKRVESFENLNSFSPTKIITIDNSPTLIAQICNELTKKLCPQINVTRSSDTYCEFVNRNASKGNAIKFLADKWNIDTSEIMAMGDHDNDIEMIEAAGFGVAMGNATPKLKQTAKYVTGTVDNDGAADAIEKFAIEGVPYAV